MTFLDSTTKVRLGHIHATRFTWHDVEDRYGLAVVIEHVVILDELYGHGILEDNRRVVWTSRDEITPTVESTDDEPATLEQVQARAERANAAWGNQGVGAGRRRRRGLAVDADGARARSENSLESLARRAREKR